MSRVRKYLNIDVLTAAKDRLRHVYDIFDSVAVCFSGGKDSLAALHLTREIAEERGKLPVDVIFRDEELIPDQVIEFVDEYRKLDWIRLCTTGAFCTTGPGPAQQNEWGEVKPCPLPIYWTWPCKDAPPQLKTRIGKDAE